MIEEDLDRHTNTTTSEEVCKMDLFMHEITNYRIDHFAKQYSALTRPVFLLWTITNVVIVLSCFLEPYTAEPLFNDHSGKLKTFGLGGNIWCKIKLYQISAKDCIDSLFVCRYRMLLPCVVVSDRFDYSLKIEHNLVHVHAHKSSLQLVIFLIKVHMPFDHESCQSI